MKPASVIDAGPSLNFFSVNKERLLIGVLGRLRAPEAVEREVLRKSRTDKRFSAAAPVWRKLTPNWLEIMSDDSTPELEAAVRLITEQPMQERLKHPKDLGETMVVAHAVAAAQSGEHVTVLIDDGQGAQMAAIQANRLNRLRASMPALGSIRLASTLTVLRTAAGGPHIPDRSAMRSTYTRMRALDDGLPPLESTRLLSSELWSMSCH